MVAALVQATLRRDARSQGGERPFNRGKRSASDLATVRSLWRNPRVAPAVDSNDVTVRVEDVGFSVEAHPDSPTSPLDHRMPAALPRVHDGRVLFIGGWGRCGSTLLDMMLGQVSNVVSAGELREIWLRGCVENRPCGCGAPFWDCSFWRDVGEHAFGGWDQLDLLSSLQTRYALDRPWGMPAVLLRPATARGSAAMEQYTDALSGSSPPSAPSLAATW